MVSFNKIQLQFILSYTGFAFPVKNALSALYLLLWKRCSYDLPSGGN